MVGCFSGSHQDRTTLQELSQPHRVDPQTLGSQCGTCFGAGEEVMGVVIVSMKVKDGMIVRYEDEGHFFI